MRLRVVSLFRRGEQNTSRLYAHFIMLLNGQFVRFFQSKLGIVIYILGSSVITSLDLVNFYFFILKTIVTYYNKLHLYENPTKNIGPGAVRIH